MFSCSYPSSVLNVFLTKRRTIAICATRSGRWLAGQRINATRANDPHLHCVVGASQVLIVLQSQGNDCVEARASRVGKPDANVVRIVFIPVPLPITKTLLVGNNPHASFLIGGHLE